MVELWQQASNEHVRAGAGEVLVAVAPELMVTHVAAVIDALADPTQFSRLAAVGILQKMQGHGLLPQAVLREHDARLMRALQAEHCDDAVRDLVANEIMTVAFAPGSLGAVDASQSFHDAAGSGFGGGGGGGGGGGAGGAGGGGTGSGHVAAGGSGGAGSSSDGSPLEQLRAVLGAEVPEALLLGLLRESHNDLNFAVNLHMSRLHDDEPPGLAAG